jgi:hypothetical protein
MNELLHDMKELLVSINSKEDLTDAGILKDHDNGNYLHDLHRIQHSTIELLCPLTRSERGNDSN